MKWSHGVVICSVGILAAFYQYYVQQRYPSVGSIDWDIFSIQSIDRPVLLRNPPTQKWLANKKWSHEYLIHEIQGKKSIQYRNPPVFVHYDTSLKLADRFPPNYERKLLSMKELFDRILSSADDGSGFYFNDQIESVSKPLLHDLAPLAPLLINDPPTFPLENYDHVAKMVKLWIGGPTGLVANLHYDATHNIFHQVSGSKRFTLLSPDKWKYLSVYSRLHPSHRQSQIIGNRSALVALKPFEIVLKPGDTLYLPPFWFHQVETLEPSVSVNVWSNSKTLNDLQHALQQPLPYLSEFERDGYVFDSDSHVYYFQRFILQLVEKTIDYPHDFMKTIIDNAKLQLPASRERISCGKVSENLQADRRMQEILSEWIEKSFKPMNQDSRWILVASFIESITSEFVRPDLVHIFLQKSFKIMQRKNVATRLIRFIDEKGMIRHGQMVGNEFNQSDIIENDDIFGSRTLTGERVSIKKLLAPLQPTQIIGIGLNYRKHAEETNMALPEHPVVFFKNNHAIQHPNDPIIIPSIALSPPEVDYEVELAVVIGKTCKNVSETSALKYVLGYTVANDVSARRWQGKRSGNQWCRAKSFDTFCPLGPLIVTDIHDPQNLSLSTVLNGKTMQSSNTRDMIFSVSQLISRLSEAMTLAKGTVILTGTPEGVGFTRDPAVYLHPGDTVVTLIEGIGALENNVIAQVKSAL